MDFVKGLFDSEDSDPGAARKNRKKMNKNYEKAERYNSRKKSKSGDNDVNGVPRTPKRVNKVAPVENEPGPAEQNIPMESLEPSEERRTMPPRSKSRAFVLPSGLIIGSDDDSSIHTSTLSSHSSDSFNPNKSLEIEDVDNGKSS